MIANLIHLQDLMLLLLSSVIWDNPEEEKLSVYATGKVLFFLLVTIIEMIDLLFHKE